MTDSTPMGTPAGGSALSADAEPTGNDGTMGAATPSGDAGADTLTGSASDEDPLTDDDALSSNDAVTTGETYSNDPLEDDEIKEELDR